MLDRALARGGVRIAHRIPYPSNLVGKVGVEPT
jgi:hypothetical protein